MTATAKTTDLVSLADFLISGDVASNRHTNDPDRVTLSFEPAEEQNTGTLRMTRHLGGSCRLALTGWCPANVALDDDMPGQLTVKTHPFVSLVYRLPLVSETTIKGIPEDEMYLGVGTTNYILALEKDTLVLGEPAHRLGSMDLQGNAPPFKALANTTSTDALRPSLQAVNILPTPEGEEHPAYLIAANGPTLLYAPLPDAIQAFRMPVEAARILRLFSGRVQFFTSLSSDPDVQVTRRIFAFDAEHGAAVSWLQPRESFPKWEHLVPDYDGGGTATISRAAALRQAIDRVLPCRETHFHKPVELRFEARSPITLHAWPHDQKPDAITTIAGSHYTGPQTHAVVNMERLLTIAEALQGTVRLDVIPAAEQSGEPLRLTDADGTKALVCPVQTGYGYKDLAQTQDSLNPATA